MQQPHFMFYYYIYSVYIYLYKYIHKYLTCTTNFEKGGEERTQKTYEDLWRWGEQGEEAQGCSLWG